MPAGFGTEPNKTVVLFGKEKCTRPAQFSALAGNGAVRVHFDAVALCQMSYARILQSNLYLTDATIILPQFANLSIANIVL